MAFSRRSLFLAAAAATLLAACGPSAAQLRDAREARYYGNHDEVFAAVQTALAKIHPIQAADPAQGALITKGRWFEKDGTYEDKALGSDDVVIARDGSIFLGFLIKVVGDAPPYQVVVEASADQYRSGYSAPYHMQPDDPEMPGWIKGKVDDLTIALHGRLKHKLIAPPGATAPTRK